MALKQPLSDPIVEFTMLTASVERRLQTGASVMPELCRPLSWGHFEWQLGGADSVDSAHRSEEISVLETIMRILNVLEKALSLFDFKTWSKERRLKAVGIRLYTLYNTFNEVFGVPQ